MFDVLSVLGVLDVIGGVGGKYVFEVLDKGLYCTATQCCLA